MKKLILLFLCTVLALADTFAQREVSGIYAGGHIRRGRPGTITKLRNSGFTYLILFNVNVEADGTLTTDGETICKDGVYIFNQTQPHYQEDIANLKAEHSSIKRIEICIGGWGNSSYSNIRNLVNSQGTTSTSILYRNFKALKQAVPEIDAVNNDTEQDYDAESAAKFHIMMYRLGYKTTIAPYTYMSYWTSLVSKIRATTPRAVDRAMIQCYDGGAGNLNNVGSWNFTGVTERHPGLLDYSNDWSVDRNLAQFQAWKDEGVATGGFVWLFNDGYDETWDMNGWASGLNRIFEAVTVPEDKVAVKCYSETNYKGYCVALPEGTYYVGDLAVYGIKANDIASIEIVNDIYQARLYTSTNCTGTNTRRTKSAKALTTSFKDKICSIVVEENPNSTGISTIEKDEDETICKQGSTIVNLAGQRLNKMQRGINIVDGKKIIVN
ncbi:MAG: hypothetical protein J6I86_05980 [Bacteroidaceae bacterium]|nr:hypothetical protein [Bacteroidaceae bacterium]